MYILQLASLRRSSVCYLRLIWHIIPIYISDHLLRRLLIQVNSFIDLWPHAFDLNYISIRLRFCPIELSFIFIILLI